MLTELIAANVSLTATSITTLITDLANLSATYSILTNGKVPPLQLASTCSGQPCRSGIYTFGGYCWMHGFQVHKNHSSATCKHKADGHKDCATCASTVNKGWEDA